MVLCGVCDTKWCSGCVLSEGGRRNGSTDEFVG